MREMKRADRLRGAPAASERPLCLYPSSCRFHHRRRQIGAGRHQKIFPASDRRSPGLRRARTNDLEPICEVGMPPIL